MTFKTITKTGIGLLAASLALTLGACSKTDNPPAQTPADTATEAASVDQPAVSPQGGFAAPAESDKGGKNNPVKIGVVGAQGEQFAILKTQAEQEGIYLEYVDFTDYQQPNPATSAGDLDLNQFQHIVFLAQYNNESNGSLVPIGSTAIYPLGLYSSQYKSVDEIPQGAQVAIPNDQTNQARALQVLVSAGLLTLKPETPSLYATPDDVVTESSKVKVVPVAANQTGRTLDDPSVAAAIVNNDYVADSNLKAADAIAQDDPNSTAAVPFVNIWVSREADQTNPVYQEIVRLASGPEFGQALLDNSEGTGKVVTLDAATLQQSLTDVEQQLRENAE